MKMAKELDLTLSALLAAEVKQMVRNQTVTFSTENYTPSPYLEQILQEVEEDIKTGENITGPFHSDAELEAHLDSL